MKIERNDRRTQFAHFLTYKLGELEHWLREVIEICDKSQQLFLGGSKDASGGARQLNYRFAAFASLTQTFKDVLSVVSDTKISWRELDSVRHMFFLQQIRNAITHDGNPVINMWADGRFYIAVDFVRLDNRMQPARIAVPTTDIGTLSLEFTVDLCRHIKATIEPFTGSEWFAEPLYGAEFYLEAVNHPAVPNFARDLIPKDQIWPEFAGPNPLLAAIEKLDELASYSVNALCKLSRRCGN
jgi:hypothetical protein